MKLLKFIYGVLKLLSNEFILPIKKEYLMYRERKAFRKACNQADLASELRNGMKHAVLKDFKGDYVIINRSNFLMMRLPRRGRFDRRVKWEDVLKEANYTTK